MQAPSKATRGKLNLTADVHKWIYLAGVLDSDGSICISKATCEAWAALKRGHMQSPRYVLYINIVNTSLELMMWLVQNFGGRYKMRRRVSLKHRRTYDWRIQNNQSLEVLKLVEQFLIIKQERARLGMDFVENMPPRVRGRGVRTGESEVQRREAIYVKMKKLNQLGDTAATTESSGSLCSRDDATV